MCIGLPANSQGFIVGGGVGVAAYYDDQFEVGVSDSDVAAIRFRPSGFVRYPGRLLRSRLDVSAAFNQFLGSDFEDTDNLSINWETNRDFQYTTLQLNVSYVERLVDDYVELDDVIALTRSEEVEDLTISPVFFWQLSDRTRVSALYEFGQTSLDSSGAGFFDFGGEEFDEQLITLGWYRTLSERSELAVFGRYITFEPGEDQNDAGTETFNLSVGGTYQLFNNWSLTGSLGATRVTFDEDSLGAGLQNVVDDGQNVVFTDLQATYTGFKDFITVSADAGTTQQIDGTLDNQQGITFSWVRRYSEGLSSNLSGRYFQADRSDRQDYTISASVNWRSASPWSYSVNYRFRDQLVSSREVDAGSNRLTFEVNYSFQDLALGN